VQIRLLLQVLLLLNNKGWLLKLLPSDLLE
jgi:hypothetical protein